MGGTIPDRTAIIHSMSNLKIDCVSIFCGTGLSGAADNVTAMNCQGADGVNDGIMVKPNDSTRAAPISRHVKSVQLTENVTAIMPEGTNFEAKDRTLAAFRTCQR